MIKKIMKKKNHIFQIFLKKDVENTKIHPFSNSQKMKNRKAFSRENTVCFYQTNQQSWVSYASKTSATLHNFLVQSKMSFLACAQQQKSTTLHNVVLLQKVTASNVHNMTAQKTLKYSLQKYQRSNQDTLLVQRPTVREGDWVQSGDLLADCASSLGGELCLGKNIFIAYMPWKGYNYEDAILISERLVSEDVYTSIHIESYEVETKKTKLGKEQITNQIPDLSEKETNHLDIRGIVKLGTTVTEGQILVGKVTPIQKKYKSPYEKLLYAILEKQLIPMRDSSLRTPKGLKAKVIEIKILSFSVYKSINTSKISKLACPSKIDKLLHTSPFLKSLSVSTFQPLNLPPVLASSKPNQQKLASRASFFVNQSQQIGRKKKASASLHNFVLQGKNKLAKLPTYSKQVDRLPKFTKKPKVDLKTNFQSMNSTLRKSFQAARKASAVSHFSEQERSKLLSLSNLSSGRPAFWPTRFLVGRQQPINTRVSASQRPHTSTTQHNSIVLGKNKLAKAGWQSTVEKVSTKKKPERVQIYLAEKRKVQVGDKMAGRHGNKGIVSKILPIQDMPFLPDGTPLDMILNPLGVPSRMNVGQIYECLLGLAAKYLKQYYRIIPFDEMYGAHASRSFTFSKLYEARLKTSQKWLFNPSSPGKMMIFDGATGEPYMNPVTVGVAYMLKLVHLVDDKIHARSTGPYSLVTQQPLRGRSKFGGQRLGEMEVWAIEAYGAAFILLEMLTIKSDDISGRMTLWSNIIGNMPIYIGTPESFKVLICELQALCLDIGLFQLNKKGFLTQIDHLMQLP
eukprot:GHUV01000061.1.p1 GENE.GHUV01000061.1~~GHUV01000061.1.p1  ORF type:complete len:795 (+),score=-78.23 GHUV01000061.1:728-3112(+)